MTQLFNKKSEEAKRRLLRNNATLAEQNLWQVLRKRQIHGVRFLRQFSVNYYVLDFYAPKLLLAIEVDGPTHESNEAKEYDQKRTNYLASLRIKVIRFTNEQVLGNINKVEKEILEIVAAELHKSEPT
ncbi:MAG: hypothetical protein COW85_12370 [Ignavibacteria bacterium CG22_combo_CG10-13_8_21_14_all_37_15]|nr:DUF559 domain-containing protein [Ignavibacteria bacterium]OIO18249.1 MAG: hypothetical protein AUJ54_08475 [Ignavibacteria bacterium CG1_02_37_35]PIP76776.1 MAG: hypothetical protein COW85_12370 [Ignavibacteria bacterium CG22_combo_CG10-13_8_21_14_all_37_15]PIS44220.1 MAG: hypothetical protein COT22_11705 [Ignavibacteria bacterium CG08_land_8_20_14_0_20_37_9]PJC57068.1 MAG: hypothetical protein CO025_15250 [Ignavibacteria bacterium CG_4_9_14_0_2_um_filter_37_13]